MKILIGRMQQALKASNSSCLAAALIFLLLFNVVPLSPRVHASPPPEWWVDEWTLVYTDVDQSGTDNFRDVHEIWLKYDAEYLYLKVSTFDKAGWNSDDHWDARFSWYFDVDQATDPATIDGNNIRDTEYKLFLEDYPKSSEMDDGMGEIYLIKDMAGNGEFSEWEITEPTNYRTNPTAIWSGFKRSDNTLGPEVPNAQDLPQTTDSGNIDAIGFRVEGYYVSMYVRWDALGITLGSYEFNDLHLFCATDSEENNLNSSENLDNPKAGLSMPSPYNPRIHLDHSINGLQADTAPGPTMIFGENVTLTYNITNTGNLGLTDLVLFDDHHGSIPLAKTALAVDESLVVTVNGTVDVLGPFVNTAIVNATPPVGPDVTDSDRSYYYGVVAYTGQAFVDTNGNGALDSGEPGIPDVTVTLATNPNGILANDTTDAQGAFAVITIHGGPVTVSTDLPLGYVRTTPGTVFTDTREPPYTIHFGYAPIDSAFGVAYGTVFHDTDWNGTQDLGESGIPGVAIQLYNSTDGTLVQRTTTNDYGQYTLKVVVPGNYVIVETDLHGYVSTTSNEIHTSLATGCANESPYDFGDYIGAIISGTVFHDENENGVKDGIDRGLPGVTVSLFSSSGLMTTAVTNEGGDFTFLIHQPGTYRVVETDPPNHTSTTPNEVSVEVELGHTYDVEFGDARDQTQPVITSVTNDPEPPLMHYEATVVYVQASDNVGVTRVTIEWPGWEVQEMSADPASGFWTYTIPGQPAGTSFSVTVKAYDAAGNAGHASFDKWWTDQTAPVIVGIESSTDTPFIGETITIRVHVTDNVGVDHVTLVYDNVDHLMTLDSGTIVDGYWIHLIPGPLTETAITYTVTASDAANNTITSDPHDVQWRRRTPEITLWPRAGYGTTTVSGTGFDPNSRITLTWNGSRATSVPSVIATDTAGAFTAIITIDAPGTYQIMAIDELDNAGEAYYERLDAQQGETGLPGAAGQSIHPGYLAGLLLVAGALALISSYAVTKQNERTRDTSPTTT